MITPNDIEKYELENVDFEKLEAEIDESMKSYHGWWKDHEEAIISGEYPVSVRNEIAKKYKEAGWKYVYHQTSSENGERPGLTSFKFSNTELQDEHTKKYYHKV